MTKYGIMKTGKNTKNYKTPNLAPAKVEEMEVAYFSLGSILFIEQAFQNDLELLHIARKGITKNAVINISKILGITLEKMSDLLHTSIRTFQRKSTEEKLDLPTSEKTIEIAELIKEGALVFGGYAKFKIWLNTPLMALNGNIPLDIMDSNRGIKMLMTELKRLEQGIYS